MGAAYSVVAQARLADCSGGIARSLWTIAATVTRRRFRPMPGRGRPRSAARCCSPPSAPHPVRQRLPTRRAIESPASSGISISTRRPRRAAELHTISRLRGRARLSAQSRRWLHLHPSALDGVFRDVAASRSSCARKLGRGTRGSTDRPDPVGARIQRAARPRSWASFWTSGRDTYQMLNECVSRPSDLSRAVKLSALSAMGCRPGAWHGG